MSRQRKRLCLARMVKSDKTVYYMDVDTGEAWHIIPEPQHSARQASMQVFADGFGHGSHSKCQKRSLTSTA